ncbi:MAG: acyl-CoA dehydrogenase [Alphaproteobacteria bacterium]|nr:acyl-CoA dehydrogenase [Alphaproteobacteria bacterium]
MSYVAPVRDIRFALEQCAGLWSAFDLAADLDPDTLAAILESAGGFAADTLAPLNRPADLEGVRLEDGAVISAAGFRAAYEAFAAGGWLSLAADPAYGGQGLPGAVALAAFEPMHAANMSFGLCPMLTMGAIEALHQHGTEHQKRAYLAPLVSGAWTGTMNLTEPQAGSDLGALTTKAVPSVDGSFRLTGQKIFITWGEHDLTDNIIHLVLARMPDAPAGSRGISLFLAPKMLPDGMRNAVRCIGLEEKLGIHASPTCTMAFEGATAWLVGAENRGLSAMFTMMNSARLNVGLEGVAIADAAYQKALAYAKTRVQGGSLIIAHPDVRRMLITMKAKTLAARAICYATGLAADCAARLEDDEARAAAKAREDLLTPIAKAWSTEWGVEAASLGVQVHGGMGFVEEGGAAQFYRDARIAPIYEGTNGIQAIDLVGRKVQADSGAAMRALIADAQREADGAPHLAAAADALAAATDFIVAADRRDALAGAAAYLKLAGDVAGGMLLARGARASGDPEKTALAAFYETQVLSAAPAALGRIYAGARQLDDERLLDLAL